jgi:SAM-dependent methyltransferase
LTLHAWLRFDAIQRLLPDGARTLLEVGAGQGAVGALLARRFDYVGLEPDASSYEVAARRIGTSGSTLDVSVEDFPAERLFDVVCAFEVLEHLRDEDAALESWQRHLRPGGWLLLSVPAGPDRFGPADVKAGHYRRYDREHLVACLAEAGLSEVEVLAYGFPLGYALESVRNVYASRRQQTGTLDERTAASGRWLQAPEWAAVVTAVLAAPFRYAQRPFGRTSLGTGFVARARKRAA